MRKPSAAITRARCKISEEGTFIAKYGHLPLLEINITPSLFLLGSCIHAANLEDERQRYIGLSESANPAVLDLLQKLCRWVRYFVLQKLPGYVVLRAYGARFWSERDDLTLRSVCAYQGTECQRADWKDHKERCRTTVQHRAVLQGIGSALETDKFVEWYMVHRETVYWAVYHGELYGDIQARPMFNEVIYHRARYQSSPRKHLEAGSSHRSTRSHSGAMQQI
jgi:hypothetical protein